MILIICLKKYFDESDYTIGLLDSSFLSSNIDCSGSCYDDKKLSFGIYGFCKKIWCRLC